MEHSVEALGKFDVNPRKLGVTLNQFKKRIRHSIQEIVLTIKYNTIAKYI